MTSDATDATSSRCSNQDDDDAEQNFQRSLDPPTTNGGLELDNTVISASRDPGLHSGNEAQFSQYAHTKPGEYNSTDTCCHGFLVAFREEFASFREGEERRAARLEKAINGLRPPEIQVDPTTNFWTAYRKVADEHDDVLVSKYAADLDSSLIFAGLFSALTTAFIIQIIPSFQPDPSDLTNTLLLRILEGDSSFDRSDPLAPITYIPSALKKAQPILFASLSITMLVAFIAVLGKQWTMHYYKVSMMGNVVDRGRDHHIKLRGLQKWGLPTVIELLPVMLQLALLLFAIAFVVYLWDIDTASAQAVLVVTGTGCIFYACIVVAGCFWADCPFQTPFSIMFPKVWSWMDQTITLLGVWLRRCSTAPLSQIDRLARSNHLMSPIGRWCKTSDREIAKNQLVEDVYDMHYSMELSNPIFWRRNPLYTAALDDTNITVTAGVWLLENSTDYPVATAVAGIFSEFQWPLLRFPTTALIGLRGAYMECVRAPEFDPSVRLKALQYAAMYYVLYHARLTWNASRNRGVGKENLPPNLPRDLFLDSAVNKWGGNDLFEYLLGVEDRSQSVKSAQFLSYISPYWFCGDSDAAVRFRPNRLHIFHKLVAVLERHQAMDQTTLTNCVLCVGAAMDFPLHPDDLIRVDKSDYFAPTFKKVAEHIHGIILAGNRRHRHAANALEILLTLTNTGRVILPFVDASWINGLLDRAAEGGMNDETFTQFLRLSARRVEEDIGVEDYTLIERVETDPQTLRTTTTSQIPTPDHTLFSKIMRNVQACVEDENGWQDETVYGGLIAIRDIRQLESSAFNDDVLQTLHDAMEEDKPECIRKAACDAILVTRDQWLKSEGVRQKLEDIEFFRRLYHAVVDIARFDYRRSFLTMMKMLSEDEHWHSYLRGAMEIWLPLRDKELSYAIPILVRICRISPPGDDIRGHPLHNLAKIVEDEWALVPGRQVTGLSVDVLGPLAEVTMQLKKLVFTEDDRQAVLAVVERVIPSLEQRRDDGYEGPGTDIRDIISGVIVILQTPTVSSNSRSTD